MFTARNDPRASRWGSVTPPAPRPPTELAAYADRRAAEKKAYDWQVELAFASILAHRRGRLLKGTS